MATYTLTTRRSIPSLQQVYCSSDRGSYQTKRSKSLAYIPGDRHKRNQISLQPQCKYGCIYGFPIGGGHGSSQNHSAIITDLHSALPSMQSRYLRLKVLSCLFSTWQPMATAGSVLWLISYTVENPCGLRSASTCQTISTVTLQDAFAVPPLFLVLRYLCRALQASLLRFVGSIRGHNKWFDSDKHAS